ncbi:GAF domain-containing protein, partial [Pseudoxanthobacter sp.]|uniref:GAF domain-containing protein n=1 Tax=Pseudoxanthobacter sp. TaxID=1925742 RepID=UPI002FDF6B0B
MQNGWTLALAHLASRLLQPGDWRQAAEDGCGAICALEGVRRVAVFRLLGQGGAAPAQRCLVDCHRPGLAALGEATGVLAPPGRWLAGASGRLRKGLVATGRAAGESGPVRHFLDHFGIVRYLIAPLMVDGRWWGHIFLDIDDSGAGWTEERIAVVSTMTVLIAQAIKRDESPAAMSEATRLAMLQSSP